MDDETRQAFADLRKLIEEQETRLMARMNDQHERLILRMNDLARDFQNTKGFLIDDLLTLGRRITNVENRLDDLDKPR